MKNIIYIAVLVIFTQHCLGQETRIIYGKVIDEYLNDAAFLVVLRVGDSVIAKTDQNGNFNVEVEKEIKTITFSGIGFEETPVNLKLECSKLEIVMMLSGGDCFATPQKNERLRKKRFKKLSSVYKQAYEKGIFEFDKPCGEIQFISWLKENKPSP